MYSHILTCCSGVELALVLLNRRLPQASSQVAEIRKLLGLTPTEEPDLDGLLSDLEREEIAVRVDWRSEPHEILSDFRKLADWVEPTTDGPSGSAEDVVGWVAHEQGERGNRLVNLEHGSDGWLLVILRPDQLSVLKKLAKSAGLEIKGLA